jgi:N-acetylgalactosamine kinase
MRMDTGIQEQLAAVYGDVGDVLAYQTRRYEALLREHLRRFPGADPPAVVRAPGRVNLIGEHTDYNGYPVLPMTIDRDILIAFSAGTSSAVTVENMDARFARRAFDAGIPIPRDGQGDWGNYLKAAVQGILESGTINTARPAGINAVCSGSVPESAGLSSSSALVVAMALAFLGANRAAVPALDLAGILAKAERYAGLEGGGMDQTISLLGTIGHALRIDFFPLAVTSVPLPEGYRFVVSNSLVAAPKTASARNAYNLRVVECRLAMGVLESALREQHGLRTQPMRLADLSSRNTGVPENIIADAAAKVLHESPWRIEEIAGILGMTPEEARRKYCTTGDGSEVPEPEEGFLLLQRYRHVTTEAWRVERGCAALENGDSALFGELMNESHRSCRDDYDVSCPEIETLVSIARAHGAIGSRLTGAGFGGCTVSLVPDALVEAFISAVAREYYTDLVRAQTSTALTRSGLRNIIFPCRAVQGAGPVIRSRSKGDPGG